MARKSQKRRRVQKPRTAAWSDVFADVFRLGRGEGWTPPSTVQIRDTAKGFTVVAEFRDEGNVPVRLTTRFAWMKGGETVRVVDEQMSIRLTCAPRVSA